MPPAVDFDPMPLLHPVVTALRLVYKVNRRYPTLLQEGFLEHYETNRRIAEQFNETFNRGDLDTAASCFAEDCQNHGDWNAQPLVKMIESSTDPECGLWDSPKGEISEVLPQVKPNRRTARRQLEKRRFWFQNRNRRRA